MGRASMLILFAFSAVFSTWAHAEEPAANRIAYVQNSTDKVFMDKLVDRLVANLGNKLIGKMTMLAESRATRLAMQATPWKPALRKGHFRVPPASAMMGRRDLLRVNGIFGDEFEQGVESGKYPRVSEQGPNAPVGPNERRKRPIGPFAPPITEAFKNAPQNPEYWEAKGIKRDLMTQPLTIEDERNIPLVIPTPSPEMEALADRRNWDSWSETGFVDPAERINGRAAMLGVFALLGVEYATGQPFLETIGFGTQRSRIAQDAEAERVRMGFELPPPVTFDASPDEKIFKDQLEDAGKVLVAPEQGPEGDQSGM